MAVTGSKVALARCDVMTTNRAAVVTVWRADTMLNEEDGSRRIDNGDLTLYREDNEI